MFHSKKPQNDGIGIVKSRTQQGSQMNQKSKNTINNQNSGNEMDLYESIFDEIYFM
jgi:hypothetical protein